MGRALPVGLSRSVLDLELSQLSPKTTGSGADQFRRGEVMLAERDDGARLRALGALGVLCNKTHLIAHPELVEPAIGDAVTVEIDLIAVGAQNEAAILLGKNTRDLPVVGHRMYLDITAPLPNVVLEQPAGGIEAVAERDIDVLMRMVRRRITPDDDLPPGNFEIDADLKQIALLTTRVPAFDDDTARRDAIEEPLKLRDALAYARGDRF